MNSSPTDRLEDIVSDAERGLDQDEFFFKLQPKIRLSENRLSGFEYLIRWRHPNGDVLLPAYFISVVEESSLADQFTNRLLERAAQRLAHWQAAGHGDLSVAINLSAEQLGSRDLPARLAALCDAYGIAPRRLEIELTCFVQLDRLDWLVDAIQAVQALGVGVALDDLGAGFNSLTFLQQLPAEIVKFDRSLLAHVPANEEATAMFRKLMGIARENGKRIVIAGIETREQHAWASTLIDVEGQGYFIGEPCEESQVHEVIGRFKPADCR
ncbi:EAL domain-containing protein [Burkholderia sp. 22PA0106]|uniref:EAL domain-containing protein n=1 Tax=Burkholderia sp. 22PA0106 TaxID=3237371 RepID=UPI0039C3BF84